MGFAFLPIGIGSLIGGLVRVGWHLMHLFGEITHQPERSGGPVGWRGVE